MVQLNKYFVSCKILRNMSKNRKNIIFLILQLDGIQIRKSDFDNSLPLLSDTWLLPIESLDPDENRHIGHMYIKSSQGMQFLILIKA